MDEEDTARQQEDRKLELLEWQDEHEGMMKRLLMPEDRVKKLLVPEDLEREVQLDRTRKERGLIIEGLQWVRPQECLADWTEALSWIVCFV